MEKRIKDLFFAMTKYMSGDAGRIQHFTKVHSYSRFIGMQESLDEHTRFILECAALTHDIGIRNGEREFGRCDGKIQQEIGPAEAEKLLVDLGFQAADISRICYLIAHHHEYDNIVGIDYRILVEADFLVNLQEGNCKLETCQEVYDNIFVTFSGKQLMKDLFSVK